MKLYSSDSSISRTLRPLGGRFGPSFGRLPTLQAHSSRSCLNNSFSHHPQVVQRKQRDQLRRVFDQAPIPSLAIAKLALDHPEWVFHFGPNAGLDLLQLVDQGVYSFALLQSPALTRHHGHLPVNPRALRFRQALGARVELGELTEQGHIVQDLFHGRIRQTKPLLDKMDAKHCGNGKGQAARFACRHKGLDQASQLRPRHNKIHLVEKLTLTRSLGDQFKSGGGEGGLFHEDITFRSGVTMTFAELPQVQLKLASILSCSWGPLQFHNFRF
jgi:hypothetical protein